MFGQVVIGPPGSGKSTYCYGMYQFMSAIGRKLCVINLDPANDRLPYPDCALDIRDILTLDEIMEELDLGPNGGLMYALECLNSVEIENFVAKVKKLADENYYLLIDCPGQVELFTHHNSLYQILKLISKRGGIRLCTVSLVDSIYLTSPSQYISILLLSLRSMLQLDLPHINVISKIDKLQSYGSLPFKLDYYTEVQDLQYLKPLLEKESNSILGKKFVRLTEAIGELIEDFNLVSFEVLSVENKRSMIHLLNIIDKANGYMFGTSEIGGDTIWSEATRQSSLIKDIDVDIHERWIEQKDTFDRLEETEDRRALNEEDTSGEQEAREEDEDEAYEEDLREWERLHSK